MNGFDVPPHKFMAEAAASLSPKRQAQVGRRDNYIVDQDHTSMNPLGKNESPPFFPEDLGAQGEGAPSGRLQRLGVARYGDQGEDGRKYILVQQKHVHAGVGEHRGMSRPVITANRVGQGASTTFDRITDESVRARV